MKNPLLQSFSLPPFSKIKPKHTIPAIKFALKNLRKTIIKITKKNKKFTWQNLFQPIEEKKNSLKKIFSPIKHLNSVLNTPEIRTSYKKALLLISKNNNWIQHNTKLYTSYLSLKTNKKHYNKLNKHQKTSLNNILINFELSGINLSKNKKQKYKKITEKLLKLSCKYENNILDSTIHWKKIITNKKMLQGIPKNILKQIKHKKQQTWKITLQPNIYTKILKYCENPKIRQECYYAHSTRASNQGPHANKWDNEPIMNKIIKLRHNLAKLLGFKTYAHKSLKTKIAKNPKQVLTFLKTLIKLAKEKSKKEMKQLQNFTKKFYNTTTIQPWDITFYSEKQKQYLFNIKNNTISTYFPIKTVLYGLFKVIKKIYNVTITQRKNVSTWNTEVRFYDLFNNKNQLQGGIYLDLYTRTNKQEGAWMEEYVERFRTSKKIQKPIAYITCNFNPPKNNIPTLLTHNEIITLFHEFGHGMHHILTCIDIPGISGTNGIPWDAIEFPSQLMENFCWKKQVIKMLSKHYITKKQINNKLINNILKMKNYQSGIFLLNQLKLSLFDFVLHNQQQKKIKKIHEILKKIHKTTEILPKNSWKRFPNTFSHIFSGEYAAGYYSYLWSKILSTDAWSKFEKNGIFNKKTGKSFIKHILSQGGSEHPIKLFKNFLGRSPKLTAILKHYGIYKKKNQINLNLY
ncbi:MAG: oligopeptidase A [Candidatus Westeberhardia cardiocondylae]|nr:oligopeptidase A [Candidatus Westeberhardia cardiocondylae]